MKLSIHQTIMKYYLNPNHFHTTTFTVISESDYQIYLEDAKNYKSRWDYLLAYNDNDFEMMILPIDNLIQLNAEYKADLISNLSLSKNDSCIKYVLAYKDFNPHENYNPINKYNDFKPNPKWWQFKCEIITNKMNDTTLKILISVIYQNLIMMNFLNFTMTQLKVNVIFAKSISHIKTNQLLI